MVEAGPGRNDVTHDDVLLEAAQVIDLGASRGLSQHAGGVLERSSAEEAFGLQRGLRDAKQHRLSLGWLAAHLLDARVLFFKVELVDLFAPEEPGVARLGDANLAQHLAHDGLNVLIVDGDALQPIDFLDLIDEVLLQLLRTAYVQDFVRVDWAFGKLLAFLDVIALEDNDMLADGDEVLLLNRSLLVFDDDTALAAHAAAEVHDALNLGNLSGVLRPAGLKKFGHARQTAGDVLGLRGLSRRLGHQGAGHDLVAFTNHDVRARRNRVVGQGLALIIVDDNLRVQIFLMLDDDHGLLARGFVGFLLHGDTFDNVEELHLAGFLGKDRHVVRVPLDEDVALLNLGPIRDGNHRPDDDRSEEHTSE